MNWFLVPLLLVALVGCSAPPSAPQEDTTVIIPETTKVADASTRAALSAYSADTGVMRFAQSSAVLGNLKPGDVLVSEPSNAAPYGYLRKVSAIRRDGAETVLDTTQADLTEAISQGELTTDFQLTGDDMLRTEGLPEGATLTANPAPPGGIKAQVGVGENYGFTLNFNHTFVPVKGPNATGTIKVEGGVRFNVGYGVNVGIKLCLKVPPVCLKSFEAKVGFDQGSSLKITGDFQGVVGDSVLIGTQYFKPKVFFVGPVPVVLVPKVELYLTAGGEIKAHVNFAASESITAQAGARWTSDDGWKNISGFGVSGSVSPPTFSGSLSPRVGVQSTASLKLYDVAGPEVSLEGGVKLDVAYPRNPAWIVNGFLKSTLGFRVTIIKTLANYNVTLFDISKELGRSSNNPPTIKLTDLARPDPGQTARAVPLGVPIDFLPGCAAPGIFYFTVQDAEDGCNLKTSLTSDRDGPLSLGPTFTTTGQRTLTATVKDSQGASASASFVIDVVNAPPVITGGIDNTVSATVPLYFTLGARDPNSGLLGCDAITVTGGPTTLVSAQNGDCRYSVVFPTPGPQTLTVTARDPQGATTTDTFQILVTSPPTVPTPIWVGSGLEVRGSDGRLIPDGGWAKSCETVTLSAQATDPGGLPVKYVWLATINPGPYKVLTPDPDGKVRLSYSSQVVYFQVAAFTEKASTKTLDQFVRWDQCSTPSPIK